jgi:hypothetical protein
VWVRSVWRAQDSAFRYRHTRARLPNTFSAARDFLRGSMGSNGTHGSTNRGCSCPLSAEGALYFSGTAETFGRMMLKKLPAWSVPTDAHLRALKPHAKIRAAMPIWGGLIIISAPHAECEAISIGASSVIQAHSSEHKRAEPNGSCCYLHIVSNSRRSGDERKRLVGDLLRHIDRGDREASLVTNAMSRWSRFV